MQNKKSLAGLLLLRKIVAIFFDFFLNIYLFRLTNGNFNFILLYAAVNAVLGCVYGFFLMKGINSKNANFIFKLSYVCEIVGILMLLLLKENILSAVWIFAAISRFAKSSFYAVYETTLISSTKKDSLSSYVAGAAILENIIALPAPAIMGFLIDDVSYSIVFVIILIDALISIFIVSRMNFKVINDNFSILGYWKKAFRKKRIRQAYLVMFLKRLSGDDGVLSQLLPILLFLTLGTEFSAGSYDSLFSVIYIIMLEIVRIFNKKGVKKRFYVPLALFCLISAITMVSSPSVATVLLFYFAMKTGGHLNGAETASMIYAIGKKEKLSSYTREHQFTWNIFLTLGHLAGIGIAFVVYNNFYNKDIFAAIIVVLMVFFVLHSVLLQKIEVTLKNK